MICASVFLEDIKKAANAIALFPDIIKIVELRIDSLGTFSELEAAIGMLERPVIITCRPSDQGGNFSGSENERVSLLEKCLKYRPLYLNVELGTASEELIRKHKDQTFILSLHSRSLHYEEWESTINKAFNYYPAAVKFVPFANEWIDNLRILDLVKGLNEAGKKIIAFCSGEKGIFSRILSNSFGSAINYFSVPGARPTGKGQIPLDIAVNRYRVSDVRANWDVYGIAGNPVSHSLSPFVHNQLFKQNQIDAIYLPFKVDDFEEFISFAASSGIKGVSVTTPHKDAAYFCSTEKDEITKLAKAANTLTFEKNMSCASNSDGPGMMAAVAPHFGIEKIRNALIVGTGGTARAIAAVFKQAGIDVSFTGRDTAKVRKISKELECNCTFHPADSAKFDLVINATPIVDDKQIGFEFVKSWTPFGSLAIDVNYTRDKTAFLKEAEYRGCRIMNGLPMFVHQAAMQFEKWTDIRPEIAPLLNLVNK